MTYLKRAFSELFPKLQYQFISENCSISMFILSSVSIYLFRQLQGIRHRVHFKTSKHFNTLKLCSKLDRDKEKTRDFRMRHVSLCIFPSSGSFIMSHISLLREKSIFSGEIFEKPILNKIDHLPLTNEAINQSCLSLSIP